MQGHLSALPLVRDLNLHAENIAELPLEGSKIGINGLGSLGGVACTRSADVVPRAPLLGLFGAILGLADRQAPRDDLLGQGLGIRRGRYGTSMTHGDVALDERLANELGQVQKAKQVGDVAARLVDDLRDAVLGVSVALDQLPVAFGLLDRIEVLALD